MHGKAETCIRLLLAYILLLMIFLQACGALSAGGIESRVLMCDRCFSACLQAEAGGRL